MAKRLSYLMINQMTKSLIVSKRELGILKTIFPMWKHAGFASCAINQATMRFICLIQSINVNLPLHS